MRTWPWTFPPTLPGLPCRTELQPRVLRNARSPRPKRRRAAYRAREASLPKEIGGRGGMEPGRYGDWEVKGLATDF